MEIDKKIIAKLLQVLEEIKKSTHGQEIKNLENTETLLEEDISSNSIVIKSPIVGTAYLAPEPGAKKFVEVGKKIKKGDTIMIVEAMKTMNHIPSNSDGVVKKVCVEDGSPAEFDQELIILE